LCGATADCDAEALSGFAKYVGQHSKTREDIKRGSTPLISTTSSDSVVKHDPADPKYFFRGKSPIFDLHEN
jgi:hypothetical protein